MELNDILPLIMVLTTAVMLIGILMKLRSMSIATKERELKQEQSRAQFNQRVSGTSSLRTTPVASVSPSPAIARKKVVADTPATTTVTHQDNSTDLMAAVLINQMLSNDHDYARASVNYSDNGSATATVQSYSAPEPTKSSYSSGSSDSSYSSSYSSSSSDSSYSSSSSDSSYSSSSSFD